MAYAINSKAILPPEQAVVFPHRATAADLTDTSTVTAGGFGDLGFATRLHFIKAKIKVKALTGTLSLALETDAASTFDTELHQIDGLAVISASITGQLILQGWTDVLVDRYYRILVAVGTSISYDAEVMACPIG